METYAHLGHNVVTDLRKWHRQCYQRRASRGRRKGSPPKHNDRDKYTKYDISQSTRYRLWSTFKSAVKIRRKLLQRAFSKPSKGACQMHPTCFSWEQPCVYKGQHSDLARSVTPCRYFLTCFSLSYGFMILRLVLLTVAFVSYWALSVVAEQTEATCKFMADTANQTQMNTATFSCTTPTIFNQRTTYTWSNGSGGFLIS